MKTTILKATLVAVMTFACLIIKAQDVQVATLQHGTTMQAFYGGDALKNALAAASQGDLISLSAGSFNATTINKAVTIQGAGYVYDPDKNRHRTVLVGEFYIEVPASQTGLVIEGIYSDNSVYVRGEVKQYTLRKCRFSSLTIGVSDTKSQNGQIDRCKISNHLYIYEAENLYVNNSIIYSFSTYRNSASVLVENSYIYQSNSVNAGLFRNCIMYSFYLIGTASGQNCIGRSLSNFDESLGNIWNLSYSDIFATASNWDYSDDADYKLTSTAAATYKGTDGTQVGIYGGLTPFSDVPSNPQVTKKEISGQTDANGKLNVKITVEAQ